MSDDRKFVMVIEDEPLIRENFQELLELEGVRVMTASNGIEGLELLKQGKIPCLILLDLLMPVMNGMEFLDALSKNSAFSKIPVCVMTGISERPPSISTAGFLKKPVHIPALLKMVQDHC